MKKFTLLKLAFIVMAAVCLYGQARSTTEVAATCPSFCSHLTCLDKDGNLRFAHCVNGQCVCP
jgi:hypothetical protein